MRGLKKSTNYYSKRAALADLDAAAQRAFAAGIAIPAIPMRAGFRTIDKITEQIIRALTARPAPTGSESEEV